MYVMFGEAHEAGFEFVIAEFEDCIFVSDQMVVLTEEEKELISEAYIDSYSDILQLSCGKIKFE